jgi:hypothetical protein
MASRRRNNYPRPRSQRQVYHPFDGAQSAAQGLLDNCELLRMEIVPDGQSGAGVDAGRGLRALQYYEPGDVVGWMWGRFVTEDEWLQITQGTDPHADGGEDFVEPARRGVWRCVDVPQQASGACHLLVSAQCPMAYINHITATPWLEDSDSPNVQLAIPAHRFEEFDTDDGFEYIPVLATAAISSGMEFYLDYGWPDATWDEVRARRLQALKTPSKKANRMFLRRNASAESDSSHSQSGAVTVVNLPATTDSMDSADSDVEVMGLDRPFARLSRVRVTAESPRWPDSNSSSDTDEQRRRASLTAPLRMFQKRLTDPALSKYTCCKRTCFHNLTSECVKKQRSASTV